MHAPNSMQGRDIAVGKGLQGRGAQHRREVELAAHRLDEALRRGQGKDSQAQRPPARRARTTAETAPTAGAASLDAPPHQRPARTSVMRVSMLALAVCVHEHEEPRTSEGRAHAAARRREADPEAGGRAEPGRSQAAEDAGAARPRKQVRSRPPLRSAAAASCPAQLTRRLAGACSNFFWGTAAVVALIAVLSYNSLPGSVCALSLALSLVSLARLSRSSLSLARSLLLSLALSRSLARPLACTPALCLSLAPCLWVRTLSARNRGPRRAHLCALCQRRRLACAATASAATMRRARSVPPTARARAATGSVPLARRARAEWKGRTTPRASPTAASATSPRRWRRRSAQQQARD